MIHKKVIIGIIVLATLLLAGCVDTASIQSKVRTFILDYIPNSETIQFNGQDTVKYAYNGGFDVYGSGTVMYEGTRQPFSYWVYFSDGKNIDHSDGKCVVKQITIGEIN